MFQTTNQSVYEDICYILHIRSYKSKIVWVAAFRDQFEHAWENAIISKHPQVDQRRVAEVLDWL